MKITLEQLQLALSIFTGEMLDTFPEPTQKACGAVAIYRKTKELFTKLKAAYPDGYVNMDEFKEEADVAMKACKGELSLDIKFEVFGIEVAPPRKLTIRQADVDKFFKETLPSVVKF